MEWLKSKLTHWHGASRLILLATQTEQNGTCVGNPIIPVTGEKTLTQTDYEGSGAHPLNFVRHFKSRPNLTTPAPNNHAGLGSTWSHNHAISLTQEGSVGSTNHIAKVQFGNASDIIFNWNATHGGWGNTYSTDTLTANAQGLLYTQKTDDSTSPPE